MKNFFKKILIAPHFLKKGNLARVTTSVALSDFLLKRDFLPVTASFHTDLQNFKEANKLAKKYLEFCEGLILQGGEDITEDLNETLNLNLNAIKKVPFRDLFEIALVKEALVSNKPVFGICRGLQIINVALGGTLHQTLENITKVKHIEYLNPKKPKNDLDSVNLKKLHAIKIFPETFLFEILSKKQIQVNSAHTQAIKELAKNLCLEATDTYGLPEAISNIDKKLLAVQWHPEMDLKDENNLKIMETWLKWV